MVIDLKGRDFISTDEFSKEEIEAILQLAEEMKADRYSDKWSKLLHNKTFLMFFFNPSLRTRVSFEAAATELGGHAQFLEPKTMRLKKTSEGVEVQAGETIEDAASALDRYASGMGIRILEGAVENYGDGDKLLREYAKNMKSPIINMADDVYHPCQGVSDVMGMRQHKGDLRGKTLLMSWGHGALARSYCSVQENMLLSSRMGMNVKLAHPKGYDLPKEITDQVKANCEKNGQNFELVNDPDVGYTDEVDFVYSRNWFGSDFYEIGKQAEIERASKMTDWICTEERMKKTNNGLFIHPMPVDRGKEVTDEVASGPRSIIYDIAENRLHTQKAVMAMTIAGLRVSVDPRLF
ncbi:MAG: ornithine carbamoyltransferase [Candidatus Marinimicrobia bacterium]|nr:ornithine carbamoyltransferase [Candidatus Neomarinimicrobiota bacterium]